MIKRILILCLALIGCVAAGPAPKDLSVNKVRSLVIDGVIANGNVLKLAAPMLRMASDGSGDPIDLVINSPGGDVVTGFLFINIMEQAKQQGSIIRCFVPGIAASMAFQVLLHCSERYTLDHAFLLWHGVRVTLGGGFMSEGVTLTAAEAYKAANDMRRLDKHILAELNAELGIDEKLVKYHFSNETLHTGANLAALTDDKFIKSYSAIDGLFGVVMENGKKPAAPADKQAQFAPGTIVYMKK